MTTRNDILKQIMNVAGCPPMPVACTELLLAQYHRDYYARQLKAVYNLAEQGLRIHPYAQERPLPPVPAVTSEWQALHLLMEEASRTDRQYLPVNWVRSIVNAVEPTPVKPIPPLHAAAPQLLEYAKAYLVHLEDQASSQGDYEHINKVRAVLAPFNPKPATLGEAVELFRSMMNDDGTSVDRQTINAFLMRVPK